MGAMSAMTRRKERAGRAVELAATLLREARAQETPPEIAQARRLARNCLPCNSGRSRGSTRVGLPGRSSL
jgi:hypothetical protein